MKPCVRSPLGIGRVGLVEIRLDRGEAITKRREREQNACDCLHRRWLLLFAIYMPSLSRVSAILAISLTRARVIARDRSGSGLTKLKVSKRVRRWESAGA